MGSMRSSDHFTNKGKRSEINDGVVQGDGVTAPLLPLVSADCADCTGRQYKQSDHPVKKKHVSDLHTHERDRVDDVNTVVAELEMVQH